MSHFLSFVAIQIDDGIEALIAEYERLDQVFEAPDQGLIWLYSI